MLGVLNDQIGSILGPHAFTDVLNWDSQALLRCDAWIAHGTSRIRTLSRHASSIYRHDIAGKTSQDGASREAQLPKRRTSPQRVLKLITRPEVLLPSILALVAQYANWGTTFSLNPILAKQLGATDVTLSLILSMNALAIGLGSLAATMLANKVGARPLVYAGFALLASGIAIVALTPWLWLFFAAQTVIGFSQGISYPVLMGLSIRYVDESQRTTAMGLHQTVYAFGMFGGPALSGVIADQIGIRPTQGITAIVAIVLGIALMRLLVRHVPDGR